MTVEIGGVGSDTRKEAVTKYFTPPPDPHQEYSARRFVKYSVVVGVLALAAAVAALTIGPALLYVCAGAGGVAALGMLAWGLDQNAAYKRRWAKAEPKPTHTQMDDLVRSDMQRAAERAMHRLGLTLDELELHSRDVDPLATAAPRLAEQGRGPITVFGPAETTRAVYGNDGKLRFSVYDIMVICPTGHNLGIYRCVLDMKSGRRRNEETQEYHYNDVVAVTTVTRATPNIEIRLTGPNGVDIVPYGRALYRTFEVIVSSGDRSSIVVGIKDEDEEDRKFLLQESGIDNVIAAVRRMLREKKGGTVSSL